MLVLLMGEIASDTIIHVPSLIKIGSGFRKLLVRDAHIDTKTRTHKQGDLISRILFFLTRQKIP
jgi:hypothetical protein